jgi:hypothetical protein
MQTSDKIAWEKTLVALFEVLKLIAIPTKYQHMMMEEYFENPLHRLEKQACGMMCSLCSNGTTTMGCINWGALQSCLIAFFTCKCQTPLDLVKYIKLDKSIIFHKEDVPNKFMGPVHVLYLQLVSNRIINLTVHNDKKSLIKKTDLKSCNIMLLLGIDNCELHLLKDSFWDGITIV